MKDYNTIIINKTQNVFTCF